jgi:hypothetical protein
VVDQAPSAPTKTAGSLSFVVGTTGSVTFSSTGYPAPTLSESGALPAGLHFTAAAGTISGVPSAGTTGTYPVTIVATNTIGSPNRQGFLVTVAPSGLGFWTVQANGVVVPYGSAKVFGSAPHGLPPVVAIAGTPDGQGYWLLARSGLVVSFGDAKIGAPPGGGGGDAVAMAPTPDGKGFWVVTEHGTVRPAGDARSYGNLNGPPDGGPVVGIAATADGKGYWLLTANGRVFPFGDAQTFGHPPVPGAVGISATPDAMGYWVVTGTGRVVPFGDAGNFGSAVPGRPTVGIASTPDGKGYWLLGPTGQVSAFGDATALTPGQAVHGPVVGIAAVQ